MLDGGQANADGPASKGAGPADERKKKKSATAKALWKKGVAKVGWIAHAKARAPRARPKGRHFNRPYEKLHGVDRSGVAEALDTPAIIAEKRGQHLPGTREWVFEAVMRWRTDPGSCEALLARRWRRHGQERRGGRVAGTLLDKKRRGWHFCKHTEPAPVGASGAVAVSGGHAVRDGRGFEDALREGGGGDNATDKVDELFQVLIAEPLQNVEAPRGADDALVLIIDALDELPRDALQPDALLCSRIQLQDGCRRGLNLS